MKNHFVTGATGFIGGAIALELLKKTEDNLYCLVRGIDINQCEQRLKESLKLSALAFGENMNDEIDARCVAVKGDLHDMDLPQELNNGDIKINSMWHSAASLKYAEEDKAFIHKINVEGTRCICQLSNQLAVSNFNYVSTAYVSGKLEGKLEEKLYNIDNLTSNYYEKSKIIAENYLVNNCKAKLKILRPSIVIGHSKTYAPLSFSGMYGFIIDLKIFRRKVEKKLGFLLYHRPLKILSVPQDPINLIPIDYVADAATLIGLSDSDKKVFHLTNDTPGPVGDPIEVIFEFMQLQKPTYVTSEKAFTEIDRKLDENLDFYSSYLSGIKLFDRNNAVQVKGVYTAGYPIDRDLIRQYVQWYMNYVGQGGVKARLERKHFEKTLIPELS